MRTSLVMSMCVAAACGGSKQPAVEEPIPSPQRTAQDEFEDLADGLYWGYMERNPSHAVGLGYHDFDGRLTSYAPEAVAADIAFYQDALQRLQAASEGLTAVGQVENAVLQAAMRGALFDLEAAAWHTRAPWIYLRRFNIADYVERDYAPKVDRARAVIAACGASAAYFDQARANLPASMPRPWIAIARLQARGMAGFVDKDVRRALAGLDEPVAGALDTALGQCIESLRGFDAWLGEREADANDAFAIGEDLFLRMLRDKEGIDIALPRLIEIGEADLARNTAAVAEAARRIDPSKSPDDVFWAVKAEKPAPGDVLAEATRMSDAARVFLVDRDIVSIPTDDVARVVATPPHMRFNFAFMNSPGPFEQRKLPAFYYITPPDPTWPEAQQRAYIPSFGDLLFTSLHEVWPGHFLHGLHRKTNPSVILRSFCSYSMSEGWAHYTEEMMWQEGAAGDDPRMHLGQLGDALLRNARYKSAIALHTQGGTVEMATSWFTSIAFADPGTAMQQANRGTFDPGYLNYTLGKLMILKLRADWQAKLGADYSLKTFHDTFLSYGCAPIPVIRAAMLGPDAGPPL